MQGDRRAARVVVAYAVYRNTRKKPAKDKGRRQDIALYKAIAVGNKTP